MTGSRDESSPQGTDPRKIGRYRLGGVLATGGMAAVHLGLVRGAVGFSRAVAIKRMHPHFAGDPDFATMFVDEARLAARIQHTNVVATLDVAALGANLYIVMEYIQGVTLAQLLKLANDHQEPMPPRIAAAIVCDALEGLHAAHEAVDADGRPLGIVHRDVSPQNVLVGVDGIARVLDFGIAKANVRLHATREGSGIKGKLAYMAPEQLEGAPVVRQSDLFSASIVLWEALTSQRAYGGTNEGEIVAKLLRGPPQPPSAVRPEVGPALDSVVMRGLSRAPNDRFATARDMALALSAAGEVAAAAEVGAWVERVAAVQLAERTARARELETELYVDDGPESEADPEATQPATAPTSGRDSAHGRSADETPDAAPARSIERPRVPAVRPSASRFRVGALVALACVATAIVVQTRAERRAPAQTTVTAAPPGALTSAAAATTQAPATTAGIVSTIASPLHAPPMAVPGAATAAPTATSTSAGSSAPRSSPRPQSRAARPTIPDRL